MQDHLVAAAGERRRAEVWRDFARACRNRGDERLAAEAIELALLHERHAALLEVVRPDVRRDAGSWWAVKGSNLRPTD